MHLTHSLRWQQISPPSLHLTLRLRAPPPRGLGVQALRRMEFHQWRCSSLDWRLDSWWRGPVSPLMMTSHSHHSALLLLNNPEVLLNWLLFLNVLHLLLIHSCNRSGVLSQHWALHHHQEDQGEQEKLPRKLLIRFYIQYFIFYLLTFKIDLIAWLT